MEQLGSEQGVQFDFKTRGDFGDFLHANKSTQMF